MVGCSMSVFLILMSIGGPLSAGSNVSAYVGMVCDLLRNSLPKAAVHCQVREAKRSLLDHFYTQVGKKEVRCLIWFIFMLWKPYASHDRRQIKEVGLIQMLLAQLPLLIGYETLDQCKMMNKSKSRLLLYLIIIRPHLQILFIFRVKIIFLKCPCRSSNHVDY